MPGVASTALHAADERLEAAEGGVSDAVVGDADLSDTSPARLAEIVGTEPCTLDCVICMEQLRFPMARRDYMITPCDHLFHTGCLRPWIEHKLECPTCRLQLPEPGTADAIAEASVNAPAAPATAAPPL